jgi:WD40 repeat protein
MKINPNGLSLAIGDRNGNIRIFNMEIFQQIALVEAHDSEVLSVDYSRSIDMGLLIEFLVKEKIFYCNKKVRYFWHRAVVIVSFIYLMSEKIINLLQH